MGLLRRIGEWACGEGAGLSDARLTSSQYSRLEYPTPIPLPRLSGLRVVQPVPTTWVVLAAAVLSDDRLYSERIEAAKALSQRVIAASEKSIDPNR